MTLTSGYSCVRHREGSFELAQFSQTTPLSQSSIPPAPWKSWAPRPAGTSALATVGRPPALCPNAATGGAVCLPRAISIRSQARWDRLNQFSNYLIKINITTNQLTMSGTSKGTADSMQTKRKETKPITQAKLWTAGSMRTSQHSKVRSGQASWKPRRPHPGAFTETSVLAPFGRL